METIILIITATILSTTTMTSFSYIVSESFRDLYKEPVLLKYVITGLKIKMGSTQKSIAGWTIHFIIGMLFVIAYFLLMRFGNFSITWLSGLVYGIFIGIVGIVSWKIMFRVAARMPIVEPSVYYIQLLLAHIIFSLTTVAVYFIFTNYFTPF